ncbi:MAG TPA: hypothetical protein VGM67_00595 [Gemmatimonadaceae bacterium]|jgi:hypothetical protein
MRYRLRFAHGFIAVAALVIAPLTSVAQQNVPIVTLPAASATTATTFGAILDVRELSHGGLLVNDAGRRLITVLDSTLAPKTVVVDSVRGGPNYYGVWALGLIPYLADSTLYPVWPTLKVFDPRGVAIRSMAAPLQSVIVLKRARSDNTGRIIFRALPVVASKAQPGVPAVQEDSAPLVRIDLEHRSLDTIGYVGRPLRRTDAIAPRDLRPDGKLLPNAIASSFWSADPLRTVDDWTVLTDGSVAIVRGHDYHIDWIRPNGTKESTPKMPFDWRPLTEADKQAMVDSAQAQRLVAARNNTLMDNRVDTFGGWRPAAGTVALDTAALVYSNNDAGVQLIVLPAPKPAADSIPDYYPPIRKDAAMADRDDHLWILPTTSKQSKAGELVYDVINTKGELFERVRVPLGRYIVGFGREGTVYLATGSVSKGFTIERTKLPASKNSSN